jgi:hypothetical protein
MPNAPIQPEGSVITRDYLKQGDITDQELVNKYFEALVVSGADFMSDTSYLRLFNQLHRLDYFNPYITSGLHIFMTRPFCAFTANNLGLDSSAAVAANSLEGCMLLASLMPPMGAGLFPMPDKDGNPQTLDSKYDAGYGKSLYENVKLNGLDKLGGTPFIPIVSNLSNSISGMKDFILEKYQYDGDMAGNSTSDGKGMDESTSNGELTIGYTESSNIAITVMHYLWMMYIDKTGKGIMSPTPESIIYNYYDYMASIYWFVTGQDGMSIKLYGKLTGVFPINVPITSLVPSKRGSFTEPEIAITYQYNHAEIMNPEILYDFNYTMDEMKTNYATGSRLENDSNASLWEALKTWKTNNYAINWESVSSGDKNALAKQNKYHRLMATGKDAQNNFRYDYGIFDPTEMGNNWIGLPYCLNGKLVYRSM